MNKIELPEKSFYLSSYPRSGNTWLMYSLSMLFLGIRAEARSSFILYPHLYGDVDNFHFRTEREIDPAHPLIIKTHETHDIYKRLYPPQKCLYIYRDGRDVLLSYYFYKKIFSDPAKVVYEKIGTKHEIVAKTTKNMTFQPQEFSEFLATHVVEWLSHVKSWRGDTSVFSIRYEDLHCDFTGALRKIIDYLNIDPIRTIDEVEEEYVKSFRQYFINDNSSFFRKGCPGDWENYFTEEHKHLFSEYTGNLITELGYD